MTCHGFDTLVFVAVQAKPSIFLQQIGPEQNCLIVVLFSKALVLQVVKDPPCEHR